jgi:hypothetical protein
MAATQDVRVWTGSEWTSIKGPTGNTGSPGTPATVSVKSVVALPAGQTPTVTDSNANASVCELNFGIPAGAAGAAATITVGAVTSGAAPAVTNSGTSSAAVLNFTLQKGDKGDAGSGVTIKGTLTGTATALPAGPAVGDMYILSAPIPTAAPNNTTTGTKTDGDGIVWNGTAWTNVGQIRGPQGVKGDTGSTGTSATVSVVSTITGAPGTQAVVTDGDASPNNAALTFTIPQGAKGDPGANAQVFTNIASSPPASPSLGALWLVPV